MSASAAIWPTVFAFVFIHWATYSASVLAQDPFAENIRTTQPLTAAQEQQSFKVPAGFDVQLVASEPKIQKPLNMSFDVFGRLWLTCTTEYPYPAPLGQGHDQIVILEDTNNDGHYDKQTVFADDLNIPIGILPIGDGCIVYDIPNIWMLSDTDGDGRSDHRKKLFGPFDYSRDTHGMNNSFTRGFDGWIYACHGFNNRSTVAGIDGHQVTMNSGNTYRFKPDGSRIEHVSHGQVNPFGMTIDNWFHLYTADCHSKPLTQIIRNAYYPSFGAPHDGLGFAPSMMEHLHGSTAIAGVESITGRGFPAQFQGKLLTGNVMTSRINCDSLQQNGSTVQAIEEPDFLSTTDPWFRPVDIVMGPDDAIYVADFYNRIIGHYEVPLEHPGRDRQRGRIWKIQYDVPTSTKDSGNRNTVTQTTTTDTRSLDIRSSQILTDPTNVTQLLNLFESTNNRVRLKAVNFVVDQVNATRLDREQVAAKLTSHLYQSESADAKVACLWALARLNPTSIRNAMLQSLIQSPDAVLRGHLQRLLAEVAPLDILGQFGSGSPGRSPLVPLTRKQCQALIFSGLKDSDARVRQMAADAAGRLFDVSFMEDLVSLAGATQATDPMLVHSARIAIKLHLQPITTQDLTPTMQQWKQQVWDWVQDRQRSPQQQETLCTLMLALPQSKAAEFLFDRLSSPAMAKTDLTATIQHIANHLPAQRSADLISYIRNTLKPDVTQQRLLLTSVREGLTRSGRNLPLEVTAWAAAITDQMLTELSASDSTWTSTQSDGFNHTRPSTDPWTVQIRTTADGKQIRTFCSLPSGETLTGKLRSRLFDVPQTLSFWIAGHRGFPNIDAHQFNHIRLYSTNGNLIREAFPPRNDVAQTITWDLSEFAGQQGYLEIADGDSSTAYAWLAVGGFQPQAINIPETAPSQSFSNLEQVCDLISSYRLVDTEIKLKAKLNADAVPQADRLVLLQTIADLKGRPFVRTLAEFYRKQPTSDAGLEFIAWMLSQPRIQPLGQPLGQDDQQLRASLGQSLSAYANTLPANQHRFLVQAALTDADVMPTVLTLAESGKLSATAFTDPAVINQFRLQGNKNWQVRAEKLAASLPPLDQVWQQKVVQTVEQFRPWVQQINNQGELDLPAVANQKDSQTTPGTDDRSEVPRGRLTKLQWIQTGSKKFTKDCSACHQIAGQGNVVGPQLDGIGNRGLDRLMEDILLPNQNVDHAFLAQLFLLADGRVVTGLVTSEDASSIQLRDNQGKAVTLSLDEIDQRKPTTQSLMPADVARNLSQDELFGLVVFLLDQRQNPTPTPIQDSSPDQDP